MVDVSKAGEQMLDSLKDEYKILQDKIDKIGAFRATIKGWSVTATVGALIAIASGKGFSPSISALALDVLLGWFFWFERGQVQLGWLFNGRARDIEIQIDKQRRETTKKLSFSTPNIARSLFGVKKRKQYISHEFSNSTVEKVRQTVNTQIRLAISSDIIFYMVLGLAAWLPKWYGVPVSTPPPSPPAIIQNLIEMPPQKVPENSTSPSLPAKNRRGVKVHNE